MLCRVLLNIAAGLSHSKEMKDVFSDFVEKVSFKLALMLPN